ncbi:MAG: toxin co-regulated pilus biosynthesis Q family protein [Rickettsiales bacterium]|jgi:hypothetical protein|nr:toxin co-regulated pilus biosynthesis Q family protein [Rickettsiales bacterium]
MFQRLIAALCGILVVGSVIASDDVDRSGLVWQGPDEGLSLNAPKAADNSATLNYIHGKSEANRNPQTNHKIYRTSGLRVDNQIITNNWGDQNSFTGGADMMHGNDAPPAFNYNSDAKMPLLVQEMLEDDGGSALVMSTTDRKYNDTRRIEDNSAESNGGVILDGNYMGGEAAATATPGDAVRSWVVVAGKPLRVVLNEWAKAAGWDLVWNTSREYPISASAVFEGRFMDVSSALVRNFARATPVPYARFYKGNRVLVVSTLEDGENHGM